MSRLGKTVIPFRWNAISIAFTQGAAGTANLSSFLTNPQNRAVTYSVVGTLPTGVTHSNGVLTYSGGGSVQSTSVQFRATSGSLQAESAVSVVAINEPAANQPPVWINAPASIGTYSTSGGSFDLSPYASDPDGGSLVFSRVGGTAPSGVVVSLSGVVTIPSGVSTGGYSVTVRISDGVDFADRTFTVSVTAASGNWASRISGQDVVWYHNFENQNEIDYHLDMSKFAVKKSSTAPGGWTLNDSTTFGVHDYRLNPFRVADPGTSSGFAMEIRVLGARLATNIDAAQMFIDVTDASNWPNPANVEAKYYFVAIHADETNPQYYPPNATPGGKGWKECVVVREVVGNRVFLAARGCQYSENSATGGIAAKAFLAGCPVGKDVHGGWGRPFMALNAASSGRGNADPAASGTIPLRAKSPRQYMSEGYYAHPFYWNHSEFVGWQSQTPSAFDGHEFYIQFRCFIDPKRRDPDVPGGKLFFIDPHSGGGDQQLVGSGPDEFDGTANVFGDYGQEKYNPSNYLQPITISGATVTSNYPLCTVGNKTVNNCYQWPIGEWFTCMVRVKPGYSRDDNCPLPNAGSDTVNALVVDTTYFTPTNVTEGDGVRRLRFETTLPPLFEYFPSTVNPYLGGTFNRHSPGYFTGGGWQAEWPFIKDFNADGSINVAGPNDWPRKSDQFAGGTSLIEDAQVVNYPGGVQRMRWSCIRKGTTAFATGVPISGHKMQAATFDRYLAHPANYRQHEVDVWVKRDGLAAVQVYGLKDYIISFGTGNNKFGVNPPAYSEFKPTGYGNVWDNLAPHPSCTFYRFGDIIFSKSTIPWPN